jgi:hypothetical protein
MKARKLIGLEAMLDYQDPSANPIHDPKKGSSGGKGGNNPWATQASFYSFWAFVENNVVHGFS